MIRRTILAFAFLFMNNNVIAGEIIEGEIPQPHKTVMGLTLEKSNLNDIERVFGKAEPWIRKDKMHEPFTYCYKLTGNKLSAWVLLSFGWAWEFERLDSITVTTLPTDITGGCTETPHSLNDVVTDGNLKIGLSRKQVTSIIEATPQNKGEVSIYKFETFIKHKMPKNSPYNSAHFSKGEYKYGTIKLFFKNNEIIKYDVRASGEIVGN